MTKASQEKCDEGLTHCNVVTVNVSQVGPVYTLDGWDDQCSGTNLWAPVVGAATLNFDGSIGLGLNIVTAPGGVPVHVEARVTLPSASGSWRDSAGNSGDFILGGNPSGLGPRPPGGIGANGAGLTGTQLDGPVPSLAVDFAGPGAAITAARSDHTHARPGGANTAAGDEALVSNTPGTGAAGAQNTAFGSGALRSNTGGYTNTALGVRALYANTTGYWNTAAGPYALRFNTTGNSNTATGNAALRGNLTGNNNTADGARALENNLGSSSTAVGQKALYDNTTGSNNIAIGFEAGNVPSTG